MPTTLLTGAKVVSFDRELPETSVLISEGKITRIGERFTAITEIDSSGTTLFPGFIDLHNHGAGGWDVMESSPSDLLATSKFLQSQGVTGWLPTLVPASDEQYARTSGVIDEVIERQPNETARILGIHYEGPFVNLGLCGALHKEFFKTYREVADLDFLCTPRRGVRMTTMAPEIEGGVDLVRALRERGWVISIGHTRADVSVLDSAFLAGAHHMTHFMNAMPQLHHRDPGPIGWGLNRNDVTCDIIADGIHLEPYVLKLLFNIKGARGLNLISDSIAAAGKGDGDFQIWGETIAVKNGRTSNKHGSIAGSVITMLDAVRLMHSLGVSHVDVAQMASANPARLLGIDGECGSIEEGKRADLVAIDEQGQVKLTIVGGEVAFRA
jgi:N-acetylglucosamine-6-phosphate deacetylase